MTVATLGLRDGDMTPRLEECLEELRKTLRSQLADLATHRPHEHEFLYDIEDGLRYDLRVVEDYMEEYK